jgi:glutamate/tyrosine decarboxylase-like PLP-dependent enzyme
MTVENAPDALGGSGKGLITLRKRLQRLHGNHYTFSRTSGNQADTAYEALRNRGHSPYDAAVRNALQLARLRRSAILRYASRALSPPISPSCPVIPR